MFDVLDDMKTKIDMLKAKLTVRNCQYKIAVEGFNNIVESNDPIGIAAKTLEAMKECMPGEDDVKEELE